MKKLFIVCLILFPVMVFAAADGHPFASSADISNVDRLIATSDDTALDYIMVAGDIDPDGTTPTFNSSIGFNTTITRNGAGDYTLTFSNAFTTAPIITGLAAEDNTATDEYLINAYMVTTTYIRIEIWVYNDTSDAWDNSDAPDAVHVALVGS